MLKSLSGVAADRLNYFLARIREIAAHGDEAALIETDKLIWEIYEGWGEEEDDLTGDLDNDIEDESSGLAAFPTEFVRHPDPAIRQIQWTLRQIHDSVASFRGRSYEAYGLIRLREELEVIRAGGAGEIPADKLPMVEHLISEASAVLDSADEAVLESVLQAEEAVTLSNINSVMRSVNDVNHAMTHFAKYHPVSTDMEDRVRKIKNRCAHYREGKKLAAARVAAAAGSTVKAANLRREARALLEQDWDTIFPGEVAPLD